MQNLRRAAIAVLMLLFCASLLAQEKEEKANEYSIREHYTKYEYRIPMRDGVHLFTAVYVPKDQSHPWPFLVTRTPYSVAPYGVENYPERMGPEELAKAGYIFVAQDVRGRYMSEGEFVEERPSAEAKGGTDESTDMYDTVEWLLKHVPNNNGKVGIWGISYPGFYTAASIINSHPAIKAASPEAPMTNLYMGDDAYHGGAFQLAANFGFYAGYFQRQKNPVEPKRIRSEFDYGTNSGYDFYLNAGSIADLDRKYLNNSNQLFTDNVRHWTYDDYWKKRDLAARMKNVHCAVLTVGGWFDAEDLQAPFSLYNAIGQHNPDTVNLLVEGPWVHGGWSRLDGRRLGNADFATNTGAFYREHIFLPFFEHYLKDKDSEPLPKAYIFETGTNVWRKYDQWPPKNVAKKTLYFRESRGLSFDAPGAQGFDEYVSDPNKPVPYVGYQTLDVPQEYMVSDQRFAETRTDVLTYETAPLEQDVTIVGPISPKLFVSTTGTDSDFVVKLIDVYPDKEAEPRQRTRKNDVEVPETDLSGWEMLVRGEPFRGKFRKSFEKPEAFTPGKVEEIRFTMPDVAHTFRRGHRIMVQVQSSWFPLVDRNPQTFTDIPNAKPSDFVKATERVYHEPQRASGIEVSVME